MLKAYYEVEKFGKTLNRTYKARKRKSKSFVFAFLGILYRIWDETNFQIQDITNTSRDEANNGNKAFGIIQTGGKQYTHPYLQNNSGVDADEIGIVVGTGSTAVTPTDYALETQITNNSSSGAFDYMGGFVGTYNTDTGTDTSSFIIERIFRNASGGSITVNEAGIYTWGDGNSNIYCIIRDVLASPVVVADTEYLKVKYTLKVAV